MNREQVRPHDIRNIVHELLNELSNNQRMFLLEREDYNRRREQELLINLSLSFAASGTRSPSPACPPWPHQGPPPTPHAQHFIQPQDLLDWVGIPDLLSEDLRFIAERRKIKVSERDQARAEQLVRTRQIREWLTAPSSAQLLVHGNYDRTAHISGLSLFCMSLTHTLGERAPQFIPLTFFCGLHVDPPLGGHAHTGGRLLLQSFIRQLLERYDFHRSQQPGPPPEEARLIQNGDVAALCRLFEALVHALPHGVVLFCIVDGVLYYEREDFKDDLSRVLVCILGLSQDRRLRVPVKVLITSPTKTLLVRGPFTDDRILTMEGLVYSGMVASSSRLGREMNGELE